MTLSDLLRRIVAMLSEAGVPYMLTGSLAAAYYALPRATRDIDLVVAGSLGQIEKLVDRLEGEGFYVRRTAAREAVRNQGQFNAIDPQSGWKVDLIVAKLEWAQAGESELQLRDALAILQQEGTKLDRPYIERWVGELGLEREGGRILQECNPWENP